MEIYSCCSEPYVDITYTIVLRRKPMFFTYNLVFPCVLLMAIGTLVFLLPPESGEKVSLSVTVLLAMTVYQLLIAETIPATSEVIPLIGQYCAIILARVSKTSQSINQSINQHELAMAPHIQSSGAPEIQCKYNSISADF